MHWQLLARFGLSLLEKNKPAKALRMVEAAISCPDACAWKAEIFPVVENLRHHVRSHELRVEAGRMELLGTCALEARVHKDHRGKILETDGVETVWHACSTAENYLDRSTRTPFRLGDSKEMLRMLAYLIELGDGNFSMNEATECCFCGERTQVPGCLVNDEVDFNCSHCGEEQTFRVAQLSPTLENAFGISQFPGHTVIFLAVPRCRPEFDALMLAGGALGLEPVRLYTGLAAAPWWDNYAELPL